MKTKRNPPTTPKKKVCNKKPRLKAGFLLHLKEFAFPDTDYRA